MRRVCFTFLSLLFMLPVKGQLKTYLVPEAGPVWDIIQVQGNPDLFSPSFLYGSVSGISAWQEVLPNLSLGTGLYAHQYFGGMNPTDERPHQVTLKSHSTLLVPVRIAYRLQLPELPVSLTARLGYEFGLRTSDPLEHQASSLVTNQDGVIIQYELSEGMFINRNLHMIEAGLSADYRLPNNWQFSVQFSHFTGLREIKYTTVDYISSEGDNTQATYVDNGTRMQTTFSLGIPVSNIWENRDLRLHRRVENSMGRGGTLRKTSYIYFGGDLGGLWRSFRTTNPSIGSKPLDGTGMFRYANLHTGLYAGYMFNRLTGIDIGAYYQRSSLYYSIMYDHENDYTELSSAPMFLDIPVMFRYYYNMYKNRLFLVPSVGGSVLTHFSGPGYASGNAAFSYQSLTGMTEGNASYLAGRPVRFGFTVRASLGVEYDIPTPFPLLLTWNITYSHGLRDLDVIEVTTSLYETPGISTVTYKGSGWMASVGVRLPFSLDKDSRKCGAMPRLRR